MKERVDQIIMSFNDCINRGDLAGLSDMMTDDHVFIDAADHAISGKPNCVEAWRGFFAAFPDYRNHFARVTVADNAAFIAGHSVCSDGRPAGPALWTAKLDGQKIAEWRVYEDTNANRARLGL